MNYIRSALYETADCILKVNFAGAFIYGMHLEPGPHYYINKDGSYTRADPMSVYPAPFSFPSLEALGRHFIGSDFTP